MKSFFTITIVNSNFINSLSTLITNFNLFNFNYYVSTPPNLFEHLLLIIILHHLGSSHHYKPFFINFLHSVLKLPLLQFYQNYPILHQAPRLNYFPLLTNLTDHPFILHPSLHSSLHLLPFHPFQKTLLINYYPLNFLSIPKDFYLQINYHLTLFQNLSL